MFSISENSLFPAWILAHAKLAMPIFFLQFFSTKVWAGSLCEFPQQPLDFIKLRVAAQNLAPSLAHTIEPT